MEVEEPEPQAPMEETLPEDEAEEAVVGETIGIEKDPEPVAVDEGCGDGYASDPDSKKVNWQGKGVMVGIVVLVILWVMFRADGSDTLWEFETGAGVLSSPAIGSDGTVYVGSQDEKLYAINGKTGGKLWEFVTGGYVHSSPAIGSDGTVYVGSVDGKLYALNGKTGVKLWEFQTGSLVTSSSPAIGSDGTVYVGSRDKKLYAIKTDSKGLAKSPWPMRGQNPQHTGRAP